MLFISFSALKLSLKVFSYLSRQHNTVKYGFFLNGMQLFQVALIKLAKNALFSVKANFAAESWLNLARPLLGTFLDGFEVCGTQSEKWKPVLLRKIPASQLPAKYGGSKEWKCLPVHRNKC